VTDGFLANSALADQVDAVIFDTPLSSVRDVIDENAESRTIPGLGWSIPESLEDAAMLIARLRFGIDYSEVDYTDMPGLIDVPLLTFATTEDQTIPQAVNDLFMTEGSGAGGQYVVVPGVGHGEAWNADPTAYELAVTRFVEQLG
jgi:pimeloyl-ACP methyl ester carboxylesterase